MRLSADMLRQRSASSAIDGGATRLAPSGTAWNSLLDGALDSMSLAETNEAWPRHLDTAVRVLADGDHGALLSGQGQPNGGS